KRLHLKGSNLKISVIDKIIEENNGVFEIDINGNVSKKDKIENDMEIDVSELNQLLFGYFSMKEMIELERVKINNTEKVSELEKLFAKKKVYIQEYQ
ncbi:MAG: sterol carrier protein domain-containing protein, partial [Fusobacterium sp.]|nr:sterol carrier protein domain-containing protein [Fusobacterium sp.]